MRYTIINNRVNRGELVGLKERVNKDIAAQKQSTTSYRVKQGLKQEGYKSLSQISKSHMRVVSGISNITAGTSPRGTFGSDDGTSHKIASELVRSTRGLKVTWSSNDDMFH